jgi:hypothetical protein
MQEVGLGNGTRMRKRKSTQMPSDRNETSMPHEASVYNGDDKGSSIGCLILLLLVVPLLDIASVLIMRAGRYCPLAFVASIVGFACGAALGAYVSVRIKHAPWFSLGRWAIYGLLGMCLAAAIASQVIIVCASP